MTPVTHNPTPTTPSTHLWSKYGHVLSMGIQNTLVYRTNFLFRAAFGLVPLAATLFLWEAIYADKPAGTAIGAECRVGGEVEATVMEPFSNKPHDGFLGHSHIGSWVNLAAGTITGNLKATYGPVRLHEPAADGSRSKARRACAPVWTKEGRDCLGSPRRVYGRLCSLVRLLLRDAARGRFAVFQRDRDYSCGGKGGFRGCERGAAEAPRGARARGCGRGNHRRRRG